MVAGIGNLVTLAYKQKQLLKIKEYICWPMMGRACRVDNLSRENQRELKQEHSRDVRTCLPRSKQGLETGNPLKKCVLRSREKRHNSG